MEDRGLTGEYTTHAPPLHTSEPFRRTALNRAFAVVYTFAILALLYRHVQNLLLYSTTLLSFSMTLYLLISDLVLAFMWATAQAFRMCPIRRKEFPQDLKRVKKEKDFPGLDVFICTADPYKEPPMNVVNTALSLMAYDYPTRKISVYVSDDGGSVMTLFAFMEAAKFASHWLPFCRENNIMERSPQEYFASNYQSGSPEIEKIKLRVSAVMTNAPIILTQDCDMYSNDPQTPLRVLCYLSDPATQSKLAYVQFPQRFHGLHKNDIYASEYKRLFQINAMGFDGLKGPNYVGSGCFFHRRAFFGGPSNLVPPEISELRPDHMVEKPIKSEEILSLAHQVAGCNYENQTKWGSMNGFRYGSLVEDFYTGYRLQCEGWKSLLCHPERAAFLGDVPIALIDVLGQCKRWCIGLLEVAFSKYDTLVFGSHSMGLLMGLGYSHYAFWPIWCIPVTFYSFLPQLAFLNKVSIFPKISETWFFLYVFLFLGAYGQDFLDFVLGGGTVQRWWNAQRMWMIRGLTCYLFGSVEYMLKSLGISTHGFSLTSKVLDDEQSKRYGQGIFEFGVPSPLFVPLTMAAIINLFSFVLGLTEFLGGGNTEGLGLQMLLTGLIVVNCLPIYGAIALRSDKGKLPTQITVISTFLSLALYSAASICF
ncbi:hypothetical protein DITRI_Ditri07aG0118000 [Diplodiscus trichospermus]